MRAEFAAVYRELGAMYSRDVSVFGAAQLARSAGIGEYGLVKVKLIADVLCELGLIDASCRETAGDDVYSFRILPVRGKTNLDKSRLFARVKEEQKDER